MKKIAYLFFALAVLMGGQSCRKQLFTQGYVTCSGGFVPSQAHSLRDSLQILVDKYVAKGLPGVQVVLKNDEGWAFASAGYAKVESRERFQPCTPGWLFSITKSYTAVLIMKAKEAGTINLSQPIGEYLGVDIVSKIPGNEKITVRMLLNHTSGLEDVTEMPEFMVGQLNEPMKQPSRQRLLDMVSGRNLVFEPGTDWQYSNTNYLLLQLILEQVTGKTYADLLQQQILQPLALNHTWFKVSDQQAMNLGFPNYYFDRYANYQIENISRWNNAVANASEGYGGIAATPEDVVNFFQALIEGKVISSNSLQEMKTWVRGRNSTDFEYGAGFEYWQFKVGSLPQFGHEGDGVGCSTQVFYVPEKKVLVYINTNIGRKLFGPYLFTITDMKRDLCRFVANS